MPTTTPAVFVHGVPDTPRVWRAVLAHLVRRDVVTLSLPGFGCPAPAGFDATKEAYVRWLLDEPAGQPGPIDVVGHDWGALLVVRAVSLAPRGVRSWAVGAAETARHVDPTMKRSILALYRSAVHVGREWYEDLARITAPGLVLWGEHDPYAAARFGARLAERTGARFVCLAGCSHWWPLERPDAVAEELERFWEDGAGTATPMRAGSG